VRLPAKAGTPTPDLPPSRGKEFRGRPASRKLDDLLVGAGRGEGASVALPSTLFVTGAGAVGHNISPFRIGTRRGSGVTAPDDRR